jgi:hypothetical protein
MTNGTTTLSILPRRMLLFDRGVTLEQMSSKREENRTLDVSTALVTQRPASPGFHDPRPPDRLLWRVAVRHKTFQPRPILGRQSNVRFSVHSP